MKSLFCAGMGGGPGRGRPGLGMHGGGRPERPGEDLPDNCKLYVAGLSETLDDSMLRSLFEPYGNVLHAAGAPFTYVIDCNCRVSILYETVWYCVH